MYVPFRAPRYAFSKPYLDTPILGSPSPCRPAIIATTPDTQCRTRRRSGTTQDASRVNPSETSTSNLFSIISSYPAARTPNTTHAWLPCVLGYPTTENWCTYLHRYVSRISIQAPKTDANRKNSPRRPQRPRSRHRRKVAREADI